MSDLVKYHVVFKVPGGQRDIVVEVHRCKNTRSRAKYRAARSLFQYGMLYWCWHHCISARIVP